MRKLILALVIALTIAGSGIYYSTQNRTSLSIISLENVEALSQSEAYMHMHRETGDCVYTFEGQSGSTGSFSLGGASVTLKFDRTGKATYTRKDSQVRCQDNGHEVCIPQNC